jgi:hypothetical protein
MALWSYNSHMATIISVSFCWLFNDADSIETVLNRVSILGLLMNVEQVVEYVLAGE